MEIDFHKLSDENLCESYGVLLDELRRRKIIHSKNIVGDFGEYHAINYYNEKPGLPNLQPAPVGTKNIDAISRNGDRYAIKTTTSKSTGVFYGFNPPGHDVEKLPKFEYVIIVLLNNNYLPKRINQLTWKGFIDFRKWHSRANAWFIPITRELLSKTRTIYSVDRNEKES